jgi:hypothetical protein
MNVNTTFRGADHSPSQPRPQKQHLISCFPEDKVFWTTGLGPSEKENSLPFRLNTGTYDWQSTDVWVVNHNKFSLSNLYLFLHILIFGALYIILELLLNEKTSTLSNFCSYMRPFFIISFQKNARQNCTHIFVSPNIFSLPTWTPTFDRVKWTKLMLTLKETGTDWRKRMISKLYMDHRVKVWLDQEEPRSVQIRREGRHWYGCHQLYSTYTASTLPRKVSGGLMTLNRTSNADDLVLLAMKETVLQGMTDRLTESEWYYGTEMNVTKIN